MNRGTATATSFGENILRFNMHPQPPIEIPQPWIQFSPPLTPLLTTPPDYLFNIPVVFPIAMVTLRDLYREVELMSACCLKDFIPALHSFVIPAVGNVVRFDGWGGFLAGPDVWGSGWVPWGDGWSRRLPLLITWQGPLTVRVKFKRLNSWRNVCFTQPSPDRGQKKHARTKFTSARGWPPAHNGEVTIYVFNGKQLLEAVDVAMTQKW